MNAVILTIINAVMYLIIFDPLTFVLD